MMKCYIQTIFLAAEIINNRLKKQKKPTYLFLKGAEKLFKSFSRKSA